MEWLAVILMIVLGGAGAVIFLIATSLHAAKDDRNDGKNISHGRDTAVASILYQVIRLGGVSDRKADEILRDRARCAGPVKREVDIFNWAEGLAQASTDDQRWSLLETAVRLASEMNRTVPLAQYNSLVDLAFGLGFRTDALARLRVKYPFEYVDYAKQGRPREADRGGSATPLFVRETIDVNALAEVLGLRGEKVTRRQVISTYRRLASEHHPDRFHTASPEARDQAAARFIEITRAYEKLLRHFAD